MFANLLLLISLGVALFAGGLNLLLGCACDTRAGLVFATGGFLFSIAPWLACVASRRYSNKLWIMAALCVVGGGGLFIWLVVHVPDGHTPETACVQNRYVGGDWKFQRYALGNLLPEIDQFMLGYKLMPAVDSLFTSRQGRQMAHLTSSIYRELEADPDFHALGSVMPDVYDNFWARDFDHGHYYLYIPTRLDRRQPNPALVFLHGSGGNFKAYTWLLSRVADELGMVLIAPRYGMGDWRRRRTHKIVKAAMLDAGKVVSLDPGRLHLMGLSNGGLGVSQAGADIGDDFRSLTFLSPVFDKRAVSSTEFVQKWKNRPVLIITGRAGDRVPFSYVSQVSASMTSTGIPAVLHTIDGADHFMLFSHREKVIHEITEWLRRQSSE